MSILSDNRNTFLIAHPEKDVCDRLAKAIESRVIKTKFYSATDGQTCFSMLNNDAPDVLIINGEMSKKPAIAIVEEMMKEKSFSRTAVIILADLPQVEHFVDEIVVGRVQFLRDWTDHDQFPKALTRAMNFVNKDEPKEFRLKHLAPEERLINEGEEAKYVYFVKKGQLRATAHRNGRPVTLGEINSGEFAGEMAYINHTPRTADVFAITECELIEIPIDLLDHVLFQKPAWVKALMKTLSKRVKELNDKVQADQ